MIGSSDLRATVPLTLRNIVLDREGRAARRGTCAAPERVWILTLLGEHGQAVQEGETLLGPASNRFLPLLILARRPERHQREHP